MAQEGMGGTVLLGLTGIALGAFIVDYAFSEPGQSWYDQIAAKLKGQKPEGLPAPVLPPSVPAAAPPPMRPVLPPSVAVPYAPMPPASPDVIREVQARLNSFGFKGLAGVKMPLSVDGLLGPNTRRVLASMQRQWQLPETAYPDVDTLRTLRAMTARLAAAPPLAAPPVTYTPYPMPSAAPPMPAARRAVPRPPRATHPALGTAVPVATTPDAMAVAADLANRLGQFFQLTVPATSISHDDLAQLLSRFQQQMGLPATGLTDPHTIDVLRQVTATLPGPVRTGLYFAGAASWEDETASLGAAAQDVLRHAIASETDARTLTSLGQMLTKAGFPLAAAAVSAKAAGPAAAAGWW